MELNEKQQKDLKFIADSVALLLQDKNFESVDKSNKNKETDGVLSLQELSKAKSGTNVHLNDDSIEILGTILGAMSSEKKDKFSTASNSPEANREQEKIPSSTTETPPQSSNVAPINTHDSEKPSSIGVIPQDITNVFKTGHEALTDKAIEVTLEQATPFDTKNKKLTPTSIQGKDGETVIVNQDLTGKNITIKEEDSFFPSLTHDTYTFNFPSLTRTRINNLVKKNDEHTINIRQGNLFSLQNTIQDDGKLTVTCEGNKYSLASNENATISLGKQPDIKESLYFNRSSGILGVDLTGQNEFVFEATGNNKVDNPVKGQVIRTDMVEGAEVNVSNFANQTIIMSNNTENAEFNLSGKPDQENKIYVSVTNKNTTNIQGGNKSDTVKLVFNGDGTADPFIPFSTTEHTVDLGAGQNFTSLVFNHGSSNRNITIPLRADNQYISIAYGARNAFNDVTLKKEGTSAQNSHLEIRIPTQLQAHSLKDYPENGSDVVGQALASFHAASSTLSIISGDIVEIVYKNEKVTEQKPNTIKIPREIYDNVIVTVVDKDGNEAQVKLSSYEPL